MLLLSRKLGECASAVSSRACIECEVRDGLPTIRGKGHAHYVNGWGGQRRLIVERRRNERIRINATTEIVILEITAAQVTFAIETSEAE